MRTFSYLLPALFITIIFRAEAVSVSGRFSTAAHTVEREVPDSLDSGQLRLYQSGSLTLRGLGSPRLSFQTSLRSSLNILDRAGNDPSNRVRHALFRWAGESLTLTGGRQFVSAGVGIGTLDGGRASVRFRDFAKLDLYAGTLAPLGRSGLINSWDEGHMMGFHLLSSKIPRLTAGFSFYRRTKRVRPYFSKAGEIYPDSLWLDRTIQNGTFQVRPNSLEQQMLGMDLRHTFPSGSLYGRLDLSTSAGVEVRRGEVTLRYHVKGLTLSGDYLYRTPWTPAYSIFSIFTQRANHEISWRGDYRFNRFFSLFGGFTNLSFDGRSGHRMSGGVGVLNGYISYSGRRGYGGISDGFGGDIRKRLTDFLWVNAGVHFSSFLYEDGIGDRSTAFSSTLGLHFRPVKYLSISLEGQDMAQNLKTPTRLNPFPGFQHDRRFFFRASTWFFHSGRTRLGGPQ